MDLSETQKQLAELCMYKRCLKGIEKNVYVPYNISYYPFETSKQLYESLGRVHLLWQKIIHLASLDHKFILSVFDSLRQIDPYVSFLLKIYETSEEWKNQQQKKNALIYNRSDYFIDMKNIPKIVQYNLICVGVGFYSSQLYEAKVQLEKQRAHMYFRNDIYEQFANGVVEHYKERNLKGIFAIFISDNEVVTVFEQKHIEMRLRENGIKCRRIRISQMVQKAVLNENNDLFYDGDLISFVYWRTGYLLSDYQSLGDLNKSIEMKVKLAKSNATCIPNISLELLNLKRAQTQLSKPHVMRRYLSEEEAQLLQTCLVENFDLESLSQDQFSSLRKRVEKQKNQWVLKPNKQGGENNLYGEDIVKKLQTMQKTDRKNYIMQKWIQSPIFQNSIIHKGNKIVKTKCNYQISRYGLISVINGVVKDRLIGNSVRSRAEGQLEGFVMSGNDSLVSWIQKEAQQKIKQ